MKNMSVFAFWYEQMNVIKMGMSLMLRPKVLISIWKKKNQKMASLSSRSFDIS